MMIDGSQLFHGLEVAMIYLQGGGIIVILAEHELGIDMKRKTHNLSLGPVKKRQ
jgi:hypothetical protein